MIHAWIGEAVPRPSVVRVNFTMKWKIARVREKDRKLAQELHASVDKVVLGIKKRFALWARKNHLAPTPSYSTFVLCAATMYNAGLKPNSVTTYMTNLLRAYRWCMNRQVYARCKHALAKWHYRERHHDTKRAVPISLVEALDIASRIRIPRARFAAEMMCRTPLRLADLCDVKWKEVELGEDIIVFRLVGGKNRRSQISQERLRVYRTELSEWLWRQLSRGAKGCPGEDHIISLSATELNGILQETSGKPITSYSLRNAYHQSMIRSCTRGGRVDWKEVAERTLHRSEKTVRAYYDR